MKTIKGSVILDLIEHWHIGSVTWQDLRNHLEGKILVDEQEIRDYHDSTTNWDVRDFIKKEVLRK